ncbi:MAG: aldo/keto reductase [Microcystis panniformis Mp_MB_F_20051200_S9]|uniref:Aldo/keto reductase n=1 Tax=Microcystis panniformis Mp_MB_F_20051200_S9 TaxID=2486223 RepID=A0A552QAZ7_9CHRO|nr:MAG: aldo/keto reductase [Microcystis panniformis Mp_MB_F_20080800_S26D]TRV53359.1 MAG: aldo/keto reductase [Microcystis panniformis Mp_GB_SS_20050300_S99D]TRV53894.1 MAG: aldo/keto reductase [Microcystis panniformis Mp_GB_SS_20050300_S99]TRV62402.1 MAG: aldo/keto reductase [Microcystis panniformis Mp_MB_F_20080800_S26]TRV66386.1 MAG: aldo/keto reductase [Microcystis panniformis Mp_MB_F_20051200_S9]TRV68620.1 MAG: aldo/keto reductase [Microcystis panniformis Mp_MB_F_20051200_S6D]TRV68970.1
MRYKLLGNSGLRVSELCLGTMTFGENWGWGSDKEESRAVFRAFAEAGGNFLDTANIYTNGTSETLVGEFVKGDREKWVIATKYSLNTRPGDVNACGNHRKNLFQAVEASLKRLGTDYIDLLWLHIWDSLTPMEEVMRAFDDLVRMGKVLYIGISDSPAWIVSQANTLATLRGWTPFMGLQIEYSLKERTPERELLPMAQALNIGVTAWSPLGGGVLTGKYNQPNPVDGRLSMTDQPFQILDRDLKIAETVLEIAREIGKSPAQVALNWLRNRPNSVIPIIGARRLSQLQDNLACVDFNLTGEHLQRLDNISAISLGFPQELLASQFVRDILLGGVAAQLDR